MAPERTRTKAAPEAAPRPLRARRSEPRAPERRPPARAEPAPQPGALSFRLFARPAGASAGATGDDERLAYFGVGRENDPLEAAAAAAAGGPPAPAGAAGPAGLDAGPLELLAGIRDEGEPLPGSARRLFERRLGSALDEVRIFTDPAAERLGAHAFALGAGIVFAPGRYRPETPAGGALLAHELEHVGQQRDAGRAWIQRSNGKPHTEKLEPSGDFVAVTDAATRTTVVRFRETDWVTIVWPAGARLEVSVKPSPRVDVDGVALMVKSFSKLEITVDRAVEQAILDTRLGGVAGVAYEFQCEGSLTGLGNTPTDSKTAPLRLAVLERRRLTLPREGEISRPEVDRLEAWENFELPDPYPSFDDVQKLRKYLDGKPKANAAVLVMPDGRFVLRELTRNELRQLADLARKSRYKPEQIEHIPRYKGKAARGAFESIVIDGVEYPNLDALANLYYDDPGLAGFGAEGDLRECEVFELPDGSYGRKPLSHAQALARREQLDLLGPDGVKGLETEPGRPFHALWVAGVSGRVHELGNVYWESRREFEERLAKLDQTTDEEQRMDEIERIAMPLRDYLLIEADRERDNPRLVAALQAHEPVLRNFQLYLWTQVRDYAQKAALEAIVGAVEQIRSIVDDDTRFTRFVFGYPDLEPQRQIEALQLLGVPEDKLSQVWFILRERSNAIEVGLGNTVQVAGADPLSLETLRASAAKSMADLEGVAEQLRMDKFEALTVKGPFGDHVRTLAYRRYGFTTLNPAGYPHKDRVSQSFPAPLAGARGEFSSLGEQLYANEARTRGTFDTLEKVALISGFVVVTVALVIFLNVVGAAIAEVVFGLAAGTTAHFIVSGVIAGVLLAGAGLGYRAAMGEKLTPEEIAKELALGGATGAFFGGLGRLLKTAGTGLRLGVMGVAFFTYSAVHLKVKTGKYPWDGTDEEFAFWFYENALTFVLLEAGAVAARPLTARVGIWARAKRLGIAPEKLANFTAAATRLNRDLAAFATRPHRAANEAKALKGQYADLLQQQKLLVEEMATAIRGKERSAALEQELKAELAAIDQQLKGMDAAEFLGGLGIRPVGESQTTFEYTPVSDTKARFEKFFPQAKVTEEPGGRISVKFPNEAEPFVFVPAGTAAPPPVAVPGGPAAAKPKVNLNTATAKEIADNVPGIGQKLAEEIVKYRQDKGPFGSVDELGKVPGMGPARLTRALAFVTTEAPPPPPTVTQVQTSLAQRRVAILERSDRTGVTDATIEALRKINPLARTTDKSLAEAEQLIAQAEKVGGKKIDAAAKRALDATTKRAGKEGMATARGDELARLSDTQVGEALLAVKGLRNLGPAELRGVIHAYRAGLDLTGFLAVAKGMPTAERNFALDTYGRLKDARVQGADRILADMGRGRGSWDGGMWALEAARFAFGIENIAAFEVKVEGQGVRRDYDIVLKNGMKIELKNWATWDTDMGTKLGDQFIRDVILGLNDPAVFKSHRYVFRDPAPRSAEQIKGFLRGELQRHLNSEVAAGRLTQDRMQEVLKAFDAEPLVVISNARRAGSAPQPPPEPPPKVPPVPRVPDEEEKKKLDQLPLPPLQSDEPVPVEVE